MKHLDTYALAAVNAAHAEAQAMGHTFVGTEHLLLGLIRTSPELELPEYDASRELVTRIVGTHAPLDRRPLPYTPRAKLVFERMAAEAADDTEIRAQHLARSLRGMDDGVAYQVLQQLGTDADDAEG